MKESDNIFEYIDRLGDSILSKEELEKKILSKKKLIIKFGVDVTAPFLHLGHAVNLWLMRRFQDDGHKVIFLIGDFTTKIGDPTGKLSSRATISDQDILENSDKFIEQISRILITDDPNLFEVRRNSEWMKPMSSQRFIELLSMVTHARLISRDMFRKRIEDDLEIYMHELIYPLIQGYDSYMLESDLTIVGSDQLFNEMMGRFYQEKFGQEPQVIITTRITPGIHGKQKQSKSLGNYVALEDSPRDQYGKVMGIPDDIVILWLEVYSDIALSIIKDYEIQLHSGKLHPLKLKHILAHNIVGRYHSIELADFEKDYFVNTFSKKEFPENAPIIELSDDFISNIVDVIQNNFPELSRSEIRRLLKQKSVSIDGKKISDPEHIIKGNSEREMELKVGKRKFLRILFKN